MNPLKHTYELSFAFPHETAIGVPSIVLTVPRYLYAPVLGLLTQLVTRNEMIEYAHTYLGQSPDFVFEVEDNLFCQRALGYGKMIAVTEHVHEVTFAVLCASPALRRHTTLSLHVLLVALNACLYDGQSSSNQGQAVRLETGVAPSGYHAHAVRGEIGEYVLAYLHEQSTQETAVLAQAAEAIHGTWQRVTDRFEEWHHDDCRALVASGARLLLECPGNACDIGIYPDNYRPEYGDTEARFSCHNLDAAEQQLALLAGLGMVCRLANVWREEQPTRA